MNRFWPTSLAVWLGILVASPAGATIFGIESCGSSSAACNAAQKFVRGGGSLPPARLFSFQANDAAGTFADLGVITLSGAEIDADGLAMRSDGALFAFELVETVTTETTFNPNDTLVSDVTASRLVSLGTGSAAATSVGSATLTGREIRGAVFDVNDNLWVLDAASDELLQIDVSTGDVVSGSVAALTLSGGLFNLASTVNDLAIGSDGTAVLSDGAELYTVDLGTGALTGLFTDSGAGHAGLAFDPASPSSLLTYEVNGDDDLFAFDTGSPGPPRTAVLLNIFPSDNAGRGDLASRTLGAAAAAPAPGTLGLLGLALAGLGLRRRRRSEPRV